MHLKLNLAALATCLSLALTGCATTKIETTGSTLPQPLCNAASDGGSMSVLWGTNWRPDQKEPPQREAAALRGIEAFFASQPCLKQVEIRRIDVSAAAAFPTQLQLAALGSSDRAAPDKVVLIMVRELGPKLWIGLPKLVEGGTEVVLEIKVANAGDTALQADLHTHWQKGGPFYIKGVKTLDQDMQAALQQVLAADTPAP